MRSPLFSPARVFLAAFLFVIPLFACNDAPSMPGDVVSVNGQGISFREVEARRISQFAGRSSETATRGEAALQAQYAYVVRQLIEETVICQYMEKQGIRLDPTLLEAEEKLVRDDYPENTFEQTLAEEGVSLEEWRERLKRRLTVAQFLEQVLRPEISITADEVQQYFSSHSADFLIPEQWHFIQISGLDKKHVEQARNAFLANGNATEARKRFLVSINDIRMGMDRLPEDLSKELTSLGEGKSSPVKAVDNEFRSFVLLGKTPASMLEAREIAKRVEQALLEEKIRDLYAAWVEKHVKSADIRLSPALLTTIGGPVNVAQAFNVTAVPSQALNATSGNATAVNATRP